MMATTTHRDRSRAASQIELARLLGLSWADSDAELSNAIAWLKNELAALGERIARRHELAALDGEGSS
jgi:hypothetical protein